MTMSSSWVEPSVLHEAAFLLSTSSSVSRYVRLAKSLANASALKDHLESGLINDLDLLNRCRKLWNELAIKKQRDLEEIEIAIIMAILADIPTERVSCLLVEFSIYDQPPLTWISALARKLVQDRELNIVTPAHDENPNQPCSRLYLMNNEQSIDFSEPNQAFERFGFEMSDTVIEESADWASVAA